MATILCLFNLKDGVNADEYERWACESDLPTVRGLGSVNAFEVMRTSGMLDGAGTPPYAYAELIEVPNMDDFFADLGTDQVQAGAKQFQQFADNPLFIVCNKLGSEAGR